MDNFIDLRALAKSFQKATDPAQSTHPVDAQEEHPGPSNSSAAQPVNETPGPFSLPRIYASCAPLKPLIPGLDDLVHIWNFIYPDFTLYPWQEQELLRISGYIDGVRNNNRVDYTPQNPFIAGYRCPNGSGKDMTLNAATAIGLPLLYPDFYVVATSSSHDQLKYQTELHIANAIRELNGKLPVPVYDSISFYHKIKDANHGGEIKLFATDEAGRAEGWHPLKPTGRLALIINEAKSIDPAIFTALDRCWGYSHWLEVSSPGGCSGLFYENILSATAADRAFPKPPTTNKYWTRHVTWRDCPHITQDHYNRLLEKHGEGSYLVETSLNANFHEPTSDVIFHRATFAAAGWRAFKDDNDIGIGLDSAAGGDETSLYVRAGGRVIFQHHFKQADTEASADIIDNDLMPWKQSNYVFNADDGGVSHGIVDKLVRRGWHIIRRYTQSKPSKPQLYLNLGAEMWFEVARLQELGLIQLPVDPLLRNQLATRKYDEMKQGGKKRLEDKKEMKARGLPSPDRADGYIHCFYSYVRPAEKELYPPEEPARRRMTVDEFYDRANSDPEFVNQLLKQHNKPLKRNVYSLYELSQSDELR